MNSIQTVNTTIPRRSLVDDVKISSHGECFSKSCLATFNKEFCASITSFDETACLSEMSSQYLQVSLGEDNYSVCSGASSAPRISPFSRAVQKFYCELQQDKPPSEKRCQVVLQSFWNILQFGNSVNHANSSSFNRASITKAMAVENGVVRALTQVMKIYKQNVKIQSRAVLLLGILGEDSLSQQDAIADCHGVTFILAALIEHRKNANLSFEACSSLYRVTNQSKKGLFQIAHGDGAATILATMKTHIKNQGIQQYALSVLCLIASQDNLLKKLEEPELIEAVVIVMGKHKKVKPILKIGNKFLHALATRGSSRIKSALVWSQAPAIFIRIIKHFSGSEQTQRSACQALCSLCAERPEAREMLAEAGGVAILQNSMKHHPDNVALQNAACQLLGYLL